MFTMVTMFKQGTLCKMVTTFDSGFTAEKDINVYNKAASQTKAMALGFNKETKESTSRFIQAESKRWRWAQVKREKWYRCVVY